jgi:hypothetical protein
VRPWLHLSTLDELNRAAGAMGLATESGKPVRFVPPGPKDAYYEVKVFETGCVETRPGNKHDLFNALVWLAFPRTKARINAMHAAEIPNEDGKRGPLRDLLTIFDEGGAIVRCADVALIELARECRWQELFWERREDLAAAMEVVVLGHAVLEQALAPWPGITCKVIFHPMGELDEAAAAWLRGVPHDASPKFLAPFPVFGMPGWLPGTERAEFYDDTRYFRP